MEYTEQDPTETVVDILQGMRHEMSQRNGALTRIAIAIEQANQLKKDELKFYETCTFGVRMQE